MVPVAALCKGSADRPETHAPGVPSPTAAQMVEAAQQFLAHLPPSLRDRANLTYEDHKRLVWHYYPRVPWERSGVTLKELAPGDIERFKAVLRAATSAVGYQTALGLMNLEAILREIENTPFARQLRDPERFYLTVFGKPSMSGLWSFKIEGHHLVLTYVIQDGRIVSSTPFVFGANPARVPSGPHRGHRLLGVQEDLARQLYTSLDRDARRSATFTDEAPFDVHTNTSLPPTRLPEAGLPADRMTADQKRLLRRLLGVYTGLLPDDVSERLLATIDAIDPARVRFAWAGSAEPGRPHYYRVHGPTFVLEYTNSQNGANHIHVVWRDYESDFGANLAQVAHP